MVTHPEISPVDPSSKANANDISNELVEQGVERQNERICAHILPVHAPTQKSKSLITVCSSEEIGECLVVLACKAEDRDSSGQREDVLGDHLPADDEQANPPEDPKALLC